MNNFIRLFFITVFVGTTVTISATVHKEEYVPIKKYGDAYLYKFQKIKVLYLRGNYRQMGQQYGKLLGNDIKLFYDEITDYMKVNYNIQRKTLQKIAKSLFESYPERFKQLFYGIRDSSGLPLDNLLIVNAFEHYIFDPSLTKESRQGCSAIAAWGQYSKNNEVIFGRNYDFGQNIKRFNKFLTITIFNPVGSGNQVALLTYLGTLNATTAFNNKKLFLELNNGGPSIPGLFLVNRISSPIELFSMMIDSSTLKQLDKELHTIKSNYSFLINIANSKIAYSYEWAPFGVKKRSGASDGLLAATNHFVLAWGLKLKGDPFSTIKRRKNLLKMGNEYKGKFNIGIMEKILKTPINKGGATSYSVKNGFFTGYQVITKPGSQELWLRIPDYQNWVKINLQRLYNLKKDTHAYQPE